MTDPIAKRIRKIGGTTLRSIGHIALLTPVQDYDGEFVNVLDMLAERREDNLRLTSRLRQVHDLSDEHRDIASASVIENWVDEPSGAHGSFSKPAAAVPMRDADQTCASRKALLPSRG